MRMNVFVQNDYIMFDFFDFVSHTFDVIHETHVDIAIQHISYAKHNTKTGAKLKHTSHIRPSVISTNSG